MKNKIKVGITQRVDRVESHNEYRDALDQRLVDWVIRSGFLPLPIPNSLVNISESNDIQPNLDSWLHTTFNRLNFMAEKTHGTKT